MSEAITKAFKEGPAVQQAVWDFYKKNRGRSVDDLKSTYYKYEFSPTREIESLFNIPKSILEHEAAVKEVGEKGTWSTWFAGGVDLFVVPIGDVLYVHMFNITGKESLMLHALPDLERDPHKITELGTIYQTFKIKVPIDTNKLK